LGFPPPDVERKVLRQETGLDGPILDDIIKLGQAIRRLDDVGLQEAASTRTMVATASLIQAGLPPRAAAIAAIASPLSDDADTRGHLVVLIESYL